MIYLINAARELGLERIMEQVRNYENVHGVMIDVDHNWLYAYKAHLSGEQDIDAYRFYRYRDPEYNWYIHSPLIFFPVTVPIEISWRPVWWEDYMASMSNLIVRILLKPGSDPIRISYEGRLRIFQEHRQIPVLQHNAGDFTRPLIGGLSIGHHAVSGTLGGILRETDGERTFGLTCGHVVKAIGQPVNQPSPADDPTSAPIGHTVLMEQPSVPSTSLCNPFDGVSQFNRIDLGLIEIDPVIQAELEVLYAGKVDGLCPAAQLGRGMGAVFTGRSSGHRTLVIGSIGVTNNVRDNTGRQYCFEHLIELKDPSTLNLNYQTPTQSGDSGAWVLVQGPQGTEWCGMVIGGDNQTGYFILSEQIMGYLKGKGYNLSCSI